MPVLNTVTARDAVDGSEVVASENDREGYTASDALVVRFELVGQSVELTADELREFADALNDLHRKITRPVGSLARPDGVMR